MKKVILLFVCIGTMFCSYAQDTQKGAFKPVLTKEEYRQKSKRQWTAAIVMVSVGGAMVITGVGLGLPNIGDDSGNDNSETLVGALIVGGSALMLGSLGFSIPAHINKKRALSMSFKNEPASLLQKNLVFYRAVPSLSLKIRL